VTTPAIFFTKWVRIVNKALREGIPLFGWFKGWTFAPPKEGEKDDTD